MNNPETDEIKFAPYLAVKNVAKAIEFYTTILGASEHLRLSNPDGRVTHVQFSLNGSVLMLGEEFPGFSKSPETLHGTPVRLSLAVENVDATADRAVKAGATLLHPPADQFYGYRSAGIRDPFGHEWLIQHQIEKMEPAEMQRRLKEMCKGGEMPS